MKIVLAGSTGLVGKAANSFLKDKGYEVLRLVRPQTQCAPEDNNILWDVSAGSIEREKLEGVDAVVHLGGASIAGKRWNASYKDEILRSRVDSTRFLAQTLAQLKQPPKVFLCASAIGYYGPHESSVECTEKTPAASGFLPDVCQAWETATQAAQEAGIRTLQMRIGVVLSREGGALQQMWIPFQLGLGGVLGSGRQIYSWITLKEIPPIMDFLIHSDVSGPVNVTSPQPVTNYEFTKALGRAISRPTLFPVPAFGARLLFGEMADALLLTGARVIPQRLQEAGYTFKYPDIEAGFQAALT